MNETTPVANPVTVVVPVYGDLPSLLDCVASLKLNVDQAMHRVLLVNDNGPDADAIESALLDAISGEPSFFYARNDANLGFVGNCNRAVLELDTTDNDILLLNSDTVTTEGFIEELSAVLHSDPDHGAVCPRSNNATIASLPYKLRDPSAGRSISRTQVVHDKVKDLLPRYSYTPVAMGFCILIRRELITAYGLFDEIFAPGYGEENDFCLRIGVDGFKSMIAHRALVFHVGGKSFVGPRREALRSAHERLLVERYPHYTGAVRDYLNLERDPVDVFADAMAPADRIARILVDLDSVVDAQSSRILDALTTIAQTDAVFTLSAPDALARHLARKYPTLKVIRHSRLDGIWDVGLALGCNGMTEAQEFRLNRTSLRWATVDDRPASYINVRVIGSNELASDAVRAIVAEIEDAPMDTELLRERWSDISRRPGYAAEVTAVREPNHIRVLRALERRSPRILGWTKGAARGFLRKS